MNLSDLPTTVLRVVELAQNHSLLVTLEEGVVRGGAGSVVAECLSRHGLTPDLTLLLDYPAEEGLQRARARNRSGNMESEGRFELEALSFHQRIRQGYLDLAATEERIQIVNALGSEDEVAERITAVVDRFLACRRSA